ncbi:MAG: hypothetical protein AABO41_17330 [Acidobacteriota bacterium]
MNSEGKSKNALSPKLRAFAAGVICLALVACAALRVEPAASRTTTDPPNTNQSKTASAQYSLQFPAPGRGTFLLKPASSNAPALAPAAPDEPEREDLEGRDDWFYFQRTYPSTALPRDARRAAWNARKRFEINSVQPAASDRWQAIGPAPTVPAYSGNWGLTSGRINAVAVSPSNPHVVIAGSSTGGIWRSSNDGNSFAPVSDDQVDLAVGSISFSKSNPSVVYAGMGDTKAGYLGSGVLKSTDEGRSWSRVSNSSLPSPGTISKIEVDPENANRVYVAQYSKLSGAKVTSSGLYVSTDGGVNWTRLFAGAPRDVAIDPADSRKLYLGLSRIDAAADPAFGLYRSTDRGSTWSVVFTAQFDLNMRRDIRVALSPANPQILYAYYGGWNGGSFSARLRVSTDGGASFADRDTSQFDTAQFGYNTYIVASPADANVVYLGSRDVFKSTDAGFTWANLTLNFPFADQPDNFAPGLSRSHPDQHGFAFVPGNPQQFYIGNDGGVSKSNDGGASFQSLNGSMTLTQFVGLTLHPTDRNLTYGGTQDNGSQRRSFGTERWHEILTGDGGRVVLNPSDPGTVFVTYIRGNIFRFFANGDWFDNQIAWNDSFGEPFTGPRIAFYPPFTGNGVDPTLYFGSWRLFLSTNLGNTWFAPAGDLDLTKGATASGRDVLSSIAVARSNTNVIYTGSAQGRAMLSTDGGTTWSDVTHGLPDRSITSIAIDVADAGSAYLATSGFNTGHIFKTTNSGETWADISSGLPDIPVNALLIDPVVPDTVYAGTDIGVFRSTNAGSSWRSFDSGMPPVVVTQFTSQESGLIQVGTYGRGAFEFAGNQRPVIDSATWDGKKKITISGSGFGDSPRVLINGEDKTSKITISEETEIRLKAKAKKLGLVTGDNTVQVISADGVSSNVVIVTL